MVDTAVSEVTRYGSVSGAYVDAQIEDGYAEAITEIILEATTSKVAAVNGVDLSWSDSGLRPYAV